MSEEKKPGRKFIPVENYSRSEELRQSVRRSCDRLLKLLEQRFGVLPTERTRK